MLRKPLFFVLFFLLLVLPSALFSQETSADYWEEQRQYYQQYPAWELPTEAIIEWINQMETSEQELTKSQEQFDRAMNISEKLKPEIEKLQKLYESQQSLLKWTGIAVVVLGTATLTITLIK